MKLERGLWSGGSVLSLSWLLCLVKSTSGLHSGARGAGACWLRGGNEKGDQSLGRGRLPVPYRPALKTKLPLTPHPTTRASASSEVTFLSPKLRGKRGVLLRTGCLRPGGAAPSSWIELLHCGLNCGPGHCPHPVPPSHPLQTQ